MDLLASFVTYSISCEPSGKHEAGKLSRMLHIEVPPPHSLYMAGIASCAVINHDPAASSCHAMLLAATIAANMGHFCRGLANVCAAVQMCTRSWRGAERPLSTWTGKPGASRPTLTPARWWTPRGCAVRPTAHPYRTCVICPSPGMDSCMQPPP